jgi:hypothetical protein
MWGMKGKLIESMSSVVMIAPTRQRLAVRAARSSVISIGTRLPPHEEVAS